MVPSLCPQKGIHDRFLDQDGAFPVLQSMEDVVNAIQRVPQEGIQDETCCRQWIHPCH